MKKIVFCSSALLALAVLFGSAFSALARDLAVLNDNSAKAVALGSQYSCKTQGRMRIEAASAAFFDKRHQDLGSLFGAALNAELARCPTLEQVQVYGMVNNTEFVRASAMASDKWVLRLEWTKIDQAAASILTDIRSYRNLPKLESLFRPFREIPGISETNGYATFAANAKAVVDNLNRNDANFQSFAEDYARSRDQQNSKEFVEKVLTTVSYYDPPKADEFRRRYVELVDGRSASELTDYLKTNLISRESIANVVNNVSAQVERRRPAGAILVTADEQVATWIEGKLVDHEAEHSGASLEDVAGHLSLTKTFETIIFSDLLPETRSAVETAGFWFEALSEEILAQSVFDGQGIIDETSDGFYDIDLVLETSLLLADEFEQSGFSDEAQIIMEYGLSRIETLIDVGLSEYARSVVSEPMTFERVGVLREEMSAFYELSQDYPGFNQYVETIGSGIASGQEQACREQADTLLVKGGDGITIDTGAASLSLRELTCELYTNAHLLSDFVYDASTDVTIMTIEVDSEGTLVFELVSKSSPKTLTGVDPEWPIEIARLTVKPPSGQPDPNGVTECDLLAGDPADGTLLVAGVVLEDLPVDFDYDRAIDACIAAVEHDPSATRQMYQLARVLDFLGDAENSVQYIDIAADRGFGPASHLKAVSALTYRDDDAAYFDAIDWFKEAAAWGYAPAMMELTELIPAGTEMFREIPPPTNQEILNAFGPDICADEGLLVTCVFFEDVRKKVCFQTSGNEFSCEVVMKYSCDVRGKGGDPVGNFFANGLAGGGGLNRHCRQNPETDPLFVKFIKAESGRWTYDREF